MTGLDKILAQIKEEATAAAQLVLNEAQTQADDILKAAEIEGKSQAQKVAQDAKIQAEDWIDRANSAAKLLKRRALLLAKQEIINDIIDEAKQSLYALSDEEYFAAIYKMARRFAQKGQKGQIVFSKKDCERLPVDFLSKVNAAIKESGAELTLGQPSNLVNGGFILVYGGIEENCTFDALFESEREMLQDKVHALLF